MSEASEPDHDLDQPLAEQLSRWRPTPRASFRGALGRYLAATEPGYGPRPARLGLLVFACLLAGLALMLGGLVLALASG